MSGISFCCGHSSQKIFTLQLNIKLGDMIFGNNANKSHINTHDKKSVFLDQYFFLQSHFLRKSGKISISEEVTIFKYAHYLFVSEDSCTKGKTKNSFEKIHFVFEILLPKVLVIFERFSFFDIFCNFGA